MNEARKVLSFGKVAENTRPKTSKNPSPRKSGVPGMGNFKSGYVCFVLPGRDRVRRASRNSSSKLCATNSFVIEKVFNGATAIAPEADAFEKRERLSKLCGRLDKFLSNHNRAKVSGSLGFNGPRFKTVDISIESSKSLFGAVHGFFDEVEEFGPGESPSARLRGSILGSCQRVLLLDLVDKFFEFWSGQLAGARHSERVVLGEARVPSFWVVGLSGIDESAMDGASKDQATFPLLIYGR